MIRDIMDDVRWTKVSFGKFYHNVKLTLLVESSSY